MTRQKLFLIGLFCVGVVGFIGTRFYPVMSDVPTTKAQEMPLVSISVPKFSAVAEAGKIAFEANCAACHGVNAVGKDGIGPPLVHIIYEPNHHGDASFLLAVRNGVRAHHWPFGDMPKVEGVDDAEIVEIVTYVRELQRANGIQ